MTEGRATHQRGKSLTTAGAVSHRPVSAKNAATALRSKEPLLPRPASPASSQRPAALEPPQQPSEKEAPGDLVQNALRLAVFGQRSHVTGAPHAQLVKANRKELQLKEIHKTFARRLIDFTKSLR